MIEFEQYGNGSHKLIGLHGWFGDENTFKALENSLNPEHFQCVWLAHRGYGKSREIQGSYTMEEMADDALDVARSLGWEKFSVIGHSMGERRLSSFRRKRAVLSTNWSPSHLPQRLPFLSMNRRSDCSTPRPMILAAARW